LKRSSTADEQCVAREHAVAREKAVGIVGVAGCVEDVEFEAFDRELVALGDAKRHHVDLAHLAHHRDAMGAVAERSEAGDVVGVQMRVDGLDELKIEFGDELQIAIDLFQHRVDDQRLAAATAREEIGIGTRYAIEELAKDHRCPRVDIENMRLFPHGRDSVFFCDLSPRHS
jgi:hypothetical protein